MRRKLTLLAVTLLICGVAYATNEAEKQESTTGDMSGLKQFTGEIEKIDLQAKTITLDVAASKSSDKDKKTMTPESTTGSTGTPTVAPNEQTGSTSKTGTETTNQTKTSKNADLQAFKFNDGTIIAAVETEETPTTAKISDLEKGDKITVHVDAQDVIQKIEILDADE